MKINVNKIDNLNAELSIELVAEDYNPVIEKKLKELRKEAQIPGFRKGMVPMSHIQRLFGKETKYRAVNELVWENLSNYLKENSTSILGEPLLNKEKSETIDVIDTKNSVQVVFDLGLKPEFQVTLSKKDKVAYQKIKIDQELIDKEIENYSRRFGSFSDVEKTEEKELVIGKIKQLDSENQILEDGISVSDAYVSLEQVKNHNELFIGKTIGDKIVFNPKKVFEGSTEISNILRISKEDAENLDCNFELEITQVRRFTPAEVNEEMFKQAFPNKEIKSIEEFRQTLKEEFEKIYGEAEKNKFHYNLKEYVLNKVNPEIPEAFLKRYLAQTKENITPESIENDWSELKKMYQWQLIVDKISRERDIKVEKEDLLAIAMVDVERSLRYYGISSIPEETLKNLAQSKLEKEEDVENFYWRALEQKTLESLEQDVEKEEVIVSADQF